jgi:hypothetical protein
VRSIDQLPPARPSINRALYLERLEPRLLLNGAVFYVDDDFTSLTPGWGVDHFATIQDGIDAAGANDTVAVAAGTYNENITIGSSKDGLTLQGESAATTIIDGGASDSVVALNSVDGATVSGFTIRNGSAGNGGGVYVDSSDSTISGNIITGNTASLWGGGIYVNGGSPSLTNNVITDNQALFGAGTYIDYATPTYANNTIYNNTAGSCGGGLYTPGSTFTIVNSIFWNNMSFDLFPNHEIMLRSGTDLTIRHSIIQDGTGQIYALQLLGATSYSYNSTDSKANPQFVDAANGDFHLLEGSPAIDAADGDAAPAADFDGTPRVDDPLTANTGTGTPNYADIGALEYLDEAALNNEPPTVDSLQASPDPVTRPGSITLTALGVDDPDGAGTVAAVQFFRDNNGNQAFDAGTDTLLGTDTNGADGWSWTGSSAGWATGSATFFARARDAYSAYSDPVSASADILNLAPTISSLSGTTNGNTLTLAAQGVSDDSSVSQVFFYLDTSGDGQLEVGVDQQLGAGTRSGSNWTLNVNASGWADGSYTVFAQAKDNEAATSNVVTAEAYVGQRYIGRILDAASSAYVDVYAKEDMSLSGIAVTFSGGAAYSIALSGPQSMNGLGLVVHAQAGSTSVACSIKDGRTNAGDVAFIASSQAIKSITLKSSMTGGDLNGQTLGGMTFAADIDGDGDASDPTALYSEGAVGKASFGGDVAGDIWIGGTDPKKGLAFSSIQSKSGSLQGDLVTVGGGGKLSFGGDITGGLDIGGSLSSLTIKGGDFAGHVQVVGNLGKLTVSGAFRAGAQIEFGGALKSAKIGSYETDNGGADFGITGASFGKIGIGLVKLSSSSLPYRDGDFLVEGLV